MLSGYLSHLLPVFLAYLIVIASPGPSVMAIMGVAMHQGRRAALLLALGVVTGSVFWGLLAATGISTALAAYAGAIFAIKIAGGIYLLYLAWKSARSAMSGDLSQAKHVSAMGAWALYRRGVVLHLSNPKAVLGWIAIMSLGLRAGAPAHTVPVMIAGCAVLCVTVNLGYALMFSTGLMQRAYLRLRRWIDGTLALVFGASGLGLLFSRA